MLDMAQRSFALSTVEMVLGLVFRHPQYMHFRGPFWKRGDDGSILRAGFVFFGSLIAKWIGHIDLVIIIHALRPCMMDFCCVLGFIVVRGLCSSLYGTCSCACRFPSIVELERPRSGSKKSVAIE
jgi:hypothetical protein